MMESIKIVIRFIDHLKMTSYTSYSCTLNSLIVPVFCDFSPFDKYLFLHS